MHFYNTSEFDFAKPLAEPEGLRSNLIDFISRFSALLHVQPPYGVDWKAAQESVKAEAAAMPNGRFGHGLPPVFDGQMLFLPHLAHKMRPAHEGGGRAGIVLNGSPCSAVSPRPGPNEIRRWLLESDLGDAIVALPTNMFSNTGIGT